MAVQKNTEHTPSMIGAMNANTIAIIKPYERTGAKKPKVQMHLVYLIREDIHMQDISKKFINLTKYEALLEFGRCIQPI